MPFPSTPILDGLVDYGTAGLNATRPGDWALKGALADYLGSGANSVKDQVAVTANGWNHAFPHGNQEVYITLSTISGTFVDVEARISSPGASQNCYQWEYVPSATRLRLYRVIAGAATTLLTDTTHTLSSGDKIGLRVYGGGPSYLEGWITIAGVWTLVDTFTDTAITVPSDGGYLDLESGSAGNWRLNDFGGGIIGGLGYNPPRVVYGRGAA